MLMEFSAENFLSVKDKITLSMLASKDNSLDRNYVQYSKNERILKSAIVYGANASGKSNLLKAMAFMRMFVVNYDKKQLGDFTGVTPFKLDRDFITRPTKFRIVFITEGVRYIYGFSLNKEKVLDEYLYYYPNGRKSVIFERWDTINFEFKKDKDEQQTLASRTLDNRLYLSAATEWNYEKTKPVFNWFKNEFITRIDYEDPAWKFFTAQQVQKNAFKDEVKTYLKNADLGIDDLEVSIITATVDNIPNELTEDIRQLLHNNNFTRLDIKTIHYSKNSDGTQERVVFDLENEESQGTNKMFELSGPLIDILSNGYLLVMDELDARLHPLLTKYIVSLFHSNLNKKGAQIIFTSHDTNLLNLSIFRRDQIWFTEKNPETDATDVYSLVDFGIRKDENVEKGYLSGRYGAIPFLTNQF